VIVKVKLNDHEAQDGTAARTRARTRGPHPEPAPGARTRSPHPGRHPYFPALTAVIRISGTVVEAQVCVMNFTYAAAN